MLEATGAHNAAMAMPMTEVVRDLVDLIGAPTVAEIGGVKETRAVAQWQTGEREPQRPHVLRFSLQLALMICTYESRDLAKAWFHGANPALGDRVPVVLLREEALESVQVALMTAIRTFAARNHE